MRNLYISVLFLCYSAFLRIYLNAIHPIPSTPIPLPSILSPQTVPCQLRVSRNRLNSPAIESGLLRTSALGSSRLARLLACRFLPFTREGFVFL